LPTTETLDRLLDVLGVTDQERRRVATIRDDLDVRSNAPRTVTGPPADSPPDQRLDVRPIAPGELPPDLSAFTGRGNELDVLDGLTTAEGRSAVVIVAVSGIAGVGKTAFAVHWGHSAKSRFPDGQVFLNLRGYAPAEPVRPIDALGRLIRSFGVPADTSRWARMRREHCFAAWSRTRRS
jgi:hypothetical protein